MLLVSGFCGISYEVLYGRLLGNLAGDQFVVSALVLLTFLAGIGIGSLVAHRLWRHLWLIEGAIGVWAAGFVLAAPTFDATLYSMGSAQASTLVMGLVGLGPPALLIGCSIPLFSGYLHRLRGGRPFARVYTLYNVGAATTALLIEFTLLRWLGLSKTVFALGALNVALALALRVGYGELRRAGPPRVEHLAFPRRDLAALALAGVGSALFQLTMVKVAECLFGPFRETFAIVLALALGGIAAGSAITERLRLNLGTVLLGSVLGVAWVLAGLGLVAELYAASRAAFGSSTAAVASAKLLALGVLMLPASMSFGATVPALLGRQDDVARDSGRLLFVAAMGNAAGFLLMAFVLHRMLDYGALLLLVGATSAAAVFVHGRRLQPRAMVLTGLSACLLCAHQLLWDEDLLYLGHTSFRSPKKLSRAQERWGYAIRYKGSRDVFSIVWFGEHPYFFINGYVSIPLDTPTEKLVGAFSSTFSPRLDRALVLGVGSGATAGTVAALFEHTIAVEINEAVLDNLHRLGDQNFDLVSRSNATLVHDDAIHFTKASDERYSLILNTVTTPLYFSSSKLYTQDYFEVVKQRLTPDGVYVTWFDARVGERGADIILRTAQSAFEECWVGAITGAYFLLVCSPERVQVHHADAATREPIAQYLRSREIPPELVAYGVVNTNAFELVGDPNVPLNTMDHPSLEFEMATTGSGELEHFRKRLIAKIDPEALSRVTGSSGQHDPVQALVYLEIMGGDLFGDPYRKLVEPHVPEFAKRFGELELEQRRRIADEANTAYTRYRLGRTISEQGREAEAFPHFERALEMDPELSAAHYGLSRYYRSIGNMRKFNHHYQRALMLKSELPDTMDSGSRPSWLQSSRQNATGLAD